MDRQSREPSPFGWLLIVAVVVILIVAPFLATPNDTRQRLSLGEVATLVQTGKVRKLTVLGDRVQGERVDSTRFTSRKERGVALTTTLRALGVSREHLSQTAIEVKPAGNGMTWLVPLLLYGGLFIAALLLFGRAPSGGDLTMPLSQDTGRRYPSGEKPHVSFSRVAGLEEAKMELQEVVEFLQCPGKFDRLGAHVPRGVLLVGPPGCGKTLLAKAVAGEAWVPVFSASGSEFVEIFAGLGAARVRSLFARARQSAPCIVFIDEIDAVGHRRGTSLDGGSDEWEQTLNQILVEMDGFEGHESVIVLAATNRPDILDPALLRPGRFDRQVVLNLPDQAGREAILKVCTWGKPMDPEVNLGIIAQQTPGFSGADLEGMLNEAAILAARHSRQATGMAELQEAVEKVGVGPERKSRLLGPAERGVIACHEAGHALVRSLLPGCDPILRVSIVPRGTHLGYTLSLPEVDRHLRTRAELKDELAGLLAGWVAEQLVFGEASTHAADDLRQASALARRMVTRFGMSKKLGPLTYGQRHGEDFLGQEITAQRDYSQATARAIDAEVEQLVTGAGRRARTLLASHRSTLDRLARRLLEEETIEGKELAGLVARREGDTG
jgi:cell division protease FtsH